MSSDKYKEIWFYNDVRVTEYDAMFGVKIIRKWDSKNNEMWILEYPGGKKKHFIPDNERVGDKRNGKLE